MTEQEFWTIVNKAESGDIEAMKRAAFLFIEVANQHTAAGRIEQAASLIKKVDEYRKKIKTVDPTW